LFWQPGLCTVPIQPRQTRFPSPRHRATRGLGNIGGPAHQVRIGHLEGASPASCGHDGVWRDLPLLMEKDPPDPSRVGGGGGKKATLRTNIRKAAAG